MSDKVQTEGESGTNPHPPAVKAGGMRIVQDKTHLRRKSDQAVVQVEENALIVQSPKVDGITKGNNADFPPGAVQAFHDKPEPTRAANLSSKPHVIHQPRK